MIPDYPHHTFAKNKISAQRETERLLSEGTETHYRKYFCGYEILFGSDYKPSLVGDSPGLWRKVSGFFKSLSGTEEAES